MYKADTQRPKNIPPHNKRAGGVWHKHSIADKQAHIQKQKNNLGTHKRIGREVKRRLCREGFFILPYNELAIAQGPKIYQKKAL